MRKTVLVLGVALGCAHIGCSTETESDHAISPAVRSSLAALGVADVAPDDTGFALLDEKSVRVGHVTLRGERSYLVERSAIVADASWDSTRLTFSCNGTGATLISSEKGWSPSDVRREPPSAACIEALEIGRLLAPRTLVATTTGPSYFEMFEAEGACHTRETWVWGTGRCDACLASLPIMAGDKTTSCRDNYASTSCSATVCELQ